MAKETKQWLTYNWPLWLDGQKHTLIKGVHFENENSLKSAAHQAAKTHGVKVRTHARHDGEKVTVTLQAVTESLAQAKVGDSTLIQSVKEELAAMEKIVTILEPLDQDKRACVLMAVVVLLDIEIDGPIDRCTTG